MKYIANFLLFFTVFSFSQNDSKKFDGSSVENFYKSMEVIVQGKSQNQLRLLNQALEIIENNAYSIKWGNFSEKKAFEKNYDVLKKVNGLTFEETIKLAESLLEKDKAEAIEELQRKIDFLKLTLFNNTNNQQKVNSVFNITDFKLNGDKANPNLEVEFTYIGNEKLTKYIDLILQVREINTKEAITEHFQFRYDDSPLINGEKINASISLKDFAKLISSIKLPFINPNFEKYGLIFEYYFDTIYINNDLFLGRGYGSNITKSYLEEQKNELEELKKLKTVLE